MFGLDSGAVIYFNLNSDLYYEGFRTEDDLKYEVIDKNIDNYTYEMKTPIE